MKRIYLAARYSRRDELRGYAGLLAERGYQITARWLYGTHEIVDGRSVEAAHKDRIKFAIEDYNDVQIADTVISFTEPEGNIQGRGRGGRHAEFGIALALKKRCVVIGFRENVFHSLPEVHFYETWEDFLKELEP